MDAEEAEEHVQPATSSEETQFFRFLALSDGIYAIAITLLTVDLRLPEATANLTGHDLFLSLLDTWPKLLSYGTSFTVIAIYWIAHRRVFRLVHRIDSGLLCLALIHLALIAFMPFPTAVLGQHVHDPVALEFYYGSLVAIGVVNAAIWWYASSRQLLDPALSPTVVRSYHWLALSAPIFFLLMIAMIASGVGTLVSPWLLGYLAGFLYAGILLLHDDRQSRSRRRK